MRFRRFDVSTFRLFSFVFFVPFVVNTAFAAEPLPLRITANLLGPAALHPSHLGKGWPDTLVIDAQCRPTADPADVPAVKYQELKGVAKHGLGRYISHRLGYEGAGMHDFPPTSLPLSAHPKEDTVLHNGRTWPDLRRREVRLRAAQRIIEELRARPAPYVLHDNLENWRVSGPAANPHPFSLEDQCLYLRDVQQAVPETVIVGNWTGGSAWYTDDEIEQVIAATRGFMAEIGIHPKMRGSEALMRRQVEVYRRMNRAGLLVALMAINGGLESEVKAANPTAAPEQLKVLLAAEGAAEVRYTAFFAYLAREKPEHPLHMVHPFWQPAPDWDRLEEELGAPVDDILFAADGSMSRTFKHGWAKIKAPRTVEMMTFD